MPRVNALGIWLNEQGKGLVPTQESSNLESRITLPILFPFPFLFPFVLFVPFVVKTLSASTGRF
ncbi:MAG: hypothetical protein RL328_628 [Acidobacteriota bacterium]